MTSDRGAPDGDDRPRTWLASPGHLALLHRVGAALLGLGLWLFGILGLVNRLALFSTSGQPVLGLSSNGLLSVISLVVGAVLIAAAVRGGRTASTVTLVVGVAFMLSGLANAVLIGTRSNVLAFGPRNVVFSMVAGGMLVILGATGRFTSRLPTDNPYRRERHPGEEQVPDLAAAEIRAGDAESSAALAEAERAVARNGASPAQARGVAAAGRARRVEDRLDAWRSQQGPPP